MMTSDTDSSLDELPRNSNGLATTSAALTQLRDRLPAFLEELVNDAGAERLVVGLDGSLETTLAATFTVDALGANRVTGLVMPAFMSDEAIARNAEAVATALGIEYDRLQLQPVVTAFQEAVAESDGPADDLIATKTALSRLRMAAAYYVANTTDSLVVGTINRTEYLLGDITKHGDTGADCLLFADLYQTEVDALARELDIPTDFTVRSSLSSFPADQPSNPELDMSPETIDRILRLHIDKRVKATVVADHVGVDPTTVDRIAKWCAKTRHKRQQPQTPGGE